MGGGIRLFMWGYQQHYRFELKYLMDQVFDEMGVDSECDVLLVGARSPDSKNPNLVCVEPENGSSLISWFDNLLDSIEINVKDHPLKNVHYGDRASMEEKPEKIRRGSVSSAVLAALTVHDVQSKCVSFCGDAYRVDDYYVVPVIQVPDLVFKSFPPLVSVGSTDHKTVRGFPSFIHAAIYKVLDEASEELRRPEPGRSTLESVRKAEEIIRIAAKDFMYTPSATIGNRGSYRSYHDLFERFNLISSLMYEGTQGVGHLILTAQDSSAVEYILRFKEPVSFTEPRWARKTLQMAASDIALIADGERIFGLGRLINDHDASSFDAFTIDFLDHYHWELRCGQQILLRSHYGVPMMPKGPMSRDLFISNYARIFPDSSTQSQEHVWSIFNAAYHQKHGSLLVIAADAVLEAERLSQQGTGIQPTLLTEQLLARVTGIDGAIILDQHGVCHAVGVILDGPANSNCTPSRGARFNSGLRYVSGSDARRLAIIISDDHTVDIVPILRPQISRTKISEQIEQLKNANLDDYHCSRNWLDTNRFYLSAYQCEVVNESLGRIAALPRKVGEVFIVTPTFVPYDDMDDSFLIP